MRISDWSSDVCSSDLLADRCEADDFQLARAEPWDPPFAHREAVETTGFAERLSADERGGAASPSGGQFRLARREGTASRWFASNPQDRKSVGQGKGVSVRVARGGRRLLKKKKKQQKHI